MLSIVNLLLFFPSILHAGVVPATGLISQPHLNVSSFSGAPAHCVNTGKHPSWNGRLIHADCETLLTYLKRQSRKYENVMLGFYSSKEGFTPPPGYEALSWELPTTNTFQSCQVQIRMIRDFKVAEIPLDKTYLLPPLYPSGTLSTWHSIIEELEKVLTCVKFGLPGWASDGIKIKGSTEAAPIGIFMWGMTSQIARDYLEPDSVEPNLMEKTNNTETNNTAIELPLSLTAAA